MLSTSIFIHDEDCCLGFNNSENLLSIVRGGATYQCLCYKWIWFLLKWPHPLRTIIK